MRGEGRKIEKKKKMVGEAQKWCHSSKGKKKVKKKEKKCERAHFQLGGEA